MYVSAGDTIVSTYVRIDTYKPAYVHMGKYLCTYREGEELENIGNPDFEEGSKKGSILL